MLIMATTFQLPRPSNDPPPERLHLFSINSELGYAFDTRWRRNFKKSPC